MDESGEGDGTGGGRPAAVDWLFADRTTGRLTIAQPPNPPLWLFLGSVGARWLVDEGSTADAALGWIGTAGLAWWAADELIRGVNPWRRLLGVGGLAWVAMRATDLAG